MIALTATALLASLIAFSIGALFLRAFRLIGPQDEGDNFFVSVWIGLSLTGGLMLAAAFLVPLNRYTLAGVVAAGCAVTFVNRAEIVRSLNGLSLDAGAGHGFAIFAVNTFAVSLITSRDLAHFDTAFYMLPQMIWLEDNGLVTGAGLLHHRFGYNSIWLALAAPVIELSHEGRLVAIGSTVACALLVTHILYSVGRIASNRARPADWYMAVAAVPGLVSPWLLSSIVSSSPDIPVWILTVFIGWLLVLDSERRLAVPIALLAFGAMAIKVSAAPLVLGAGVYALWTRQVTVRNVIAVSLFALVTMGSAVAANIVTSGCPLFPASLFCLPVPWAVPAETAKAISLFVSQWPMLQNINAFNSADIEAYARGALPTLSFTDRVSLIAASAHPVLWTALACIVGLAAFAPRILRTPASSVALGMALLGLGYCILVPAYRFAAGWIGILLGLAFVVIAFVVLHRFKRWPQGFYLLNTSFALATGTTGIVAVALALSLVSRTSDRELREAGFQGRPTPFMARLLLPPPITARQPNPSKGKISGSEFPLTEPTVWQDVQVNDVRFKRPTSGEQCWHTREPCTPPGEPLDPLKLREPAKGIAGGFIRP
jgi:hypothetical protein